MEVEKSDKGHYLILEAKEAEELNLKESIKYELQKIKDGFFVLIEGPEKTSLPDEIEQKIISFLKNWSLSERVEGNFENKLSEEEKKKFSEMLEAGKVEKFRLNESYKKAVYKMKEGEEIQKYDNKEKQIQEYSLDKDGFLVVRNETRAKVLSEELKDKIKDGEIKGTRAFSGEFFIIKKELLDNCQKKIIETMKNNKNINLQELSEKTGFVPTLCRIGIEFLKEDGQIIEKRKEKYQYID